MKYHKSYVVKFCILFLLISLGGCSLGRYWLDDWTETDSLEEFALKGSATTAYLEKFMGLSKEGVKRGLGLPAVIDFPKYENPSCREYGQKEVEYNEIWFYHNPPVIPMPNVKGGTQTIYFNNDVVVCVHS